MYIMGIMAGVWLAGLIILLFYSRKNMTKKEICYYAVYLAYFLSLTVLFYFTMPKDFFMGDADMDKIKVFPFWGIYFLWLVIINLMTSGFMVSFSTVSRNYPIGNIPRYNLISIATLNLFFIVMLYLFLKSIPFF